MPRSIPFPQLRDEAWLRRRYEQDGAVLKEIAAEVGCTETAVFLALRKVGIPPRSAAEQRVRRGTSGRRIFPELGDRQFLEREYVQIGRSLKDIAAQVGCTDAAVRKALERDHGIPTRDEIKRTFRKKAILQLQQPGWLAHQRQVLGRSKEDIATELGCSPDAVQKALWRQHVRIREPLPRGEAFVDAAPRFQRNSKGYTFLWAPDHPAANFKGFVPFHRVVAEQELGRSLKPKEVVHHLNQTPSDNRPENLMVFATNGAHMAFHAAPPSWVPRCQCCGKPNPEVLSGRPSDVPMLYR